MKNIIRYSDKLSLIALKQNLTGFDNFIGSWLITGEKTILIDTGTSYSVPVLVKSLKELGVKKIDVILITHIHIDHAGATSSEPTSARPTCHPQRWCSWPHGATYQTDCAAI